MANTVTTYENQGFPDVNSLMIDVVSTLVGFPSVLPTEGNVLNAGEMYMVPVRGGDYNTVFSGYVAGTATGPAAIPDDQSAVIVLEATQLIDPFAALDPKGYYIHTDTTTKLDGPTGAANPPIDTSVSPYPTNATKDPWRMTFQTYDWKNYSSFTAAAPFVPSGVTGATGDLGKWTPDGAAPLSMAIYLGTPATMSTDGTTGASGPNLTLGWHQSWPNKYPQWADSTLNGGCTYYDWLGPAVIALPSASDTTVTADTARLHYVTCTYGVATNQLRNLSTFLKSYTLKKSYDFVEPIGNTGAEWTHAFDPVNGWDETGRFGATHPYSTGVTGYAASGPMVPVYATGPIGWPDWVIDRNTGSGATAPPGFGKQFKGIDGITRIRLAQDPNKVKYQTSDRIGPTSPGVTDYFPGSDGDGPDVLDPAQLFINRYPIRARLNGGGATGATGAGLGMFGSVGGRAASSNPMSYRLVLSDHGMFFAVWGENPEETASNYSWLLIQRPVSKNDGTIRGAYSDFYTATGPNGYPVPDTLRNNTIINSTAFDQAGNTVNFGNRPLFCINSTSNKFYKFVVREHDLPIPSARKDASNNSEDNGAVLNAYRQQSLTENGEYVITFINNLNSSRFKYADELDMVGTVSADIVGGGTDIDVAVYNEIDPANGQPSKRTYHALWSSGAYGTKMRIVVVKRTPNPNVPPAYA
jgi:hypothetical protein